MLGVSQIDMGAGHHVLQSSSKTDMRTTVSLPDHLSTAAEALARRLGLSRNELCATAVAEFVAKHTASEVTARLDRIYAIESSSLDPELQRAQRLAVGQERW